MTPLTLLLLAALAVALAFLVVRGRRREVGAPPPTAPRPPEPPAASPPPSPPPNEAARRLDEHVQFTVYRPRRVAPDTWCTILAFAHLAGRRADAPPSDPDPVEEVRRQAHQVLGERAVASPRHWRRCCSSASSGARSSGGRGE
jgi:hypothetical protein